LDVTLKKLIFAGAAIAALLTAAPAVALAEEEPTPCEAATAALEDGQAKKDRLDKATEALAAARANARGAVAVIAPDFPVDTASASDIQVAIDEVLRPRRDKAETDEDRALWENAMNVAKALRDALNEHQAAAEAALTIDLAALEKAKADACTPTTETPDPTTPAPTTPAPADEDDEVVRNYDLDPKETSQVGEVPVGGVDTGLA